MEMENPYSNLSDVYAFGIVLFELTTNQLPYSHYSNRDQIIFLVGRGKLKPDISQIRSDTPNLLKRLLTDCVSFVAEARPPFSQVFSLLPLNE